MPKPRSAQLIVISDLHVGSRLGICPPRVVVDDGQTVEYNELQAEMWKFWNGMWKDIDKDSKTRETVVVCNGDGLENSHHGTFQIWSNDPLEHIAVAAQILAPIASKYKMYFTRGTPAHVLASGSGDEQIAREVGAEKAGGNGVRSSYHLKLNFAGCHFDIAHQGPNPGNRLWAYGNTLRSYARTIVLDAMIRHDRPPDAVIRSHFHRKCYEMVHDYNHKCHAVVTPAFQFKTEFSTMVNSHESIADVGCAVFSIDNEKISDVEFRVLSLRQSDMVTV